MNSEIITIDIILRNPFKIIKTPALARLYTFAYEENASRLFRILIRLPARMIYKLCRRFPLLPSLGKFQLEGQTGRQNINFDSHNTQFSALYEYDSNNGYEQEVGVLIDALIPDKGIFYDIGSNWGYFSLFLASRPRYSGQIFAFEPMPDSFSDLQRCVIEAKLKNKVKCHNIAASNKNTELLMVIPDAIHSGSAEVSEAGGNIVIEAKRLDDYNLPAPDL